jgi:hypothetical protein
MPLKYIYYMFTIVLTKMSYGIRSKEGGKFAVVAEFKPN